MSYLGEVHTNDYGWIPVFDNENNIPADFPEGNVASIREPSIDLINTKRALLIFPVASSPVFSEKNITKEEMKPLEGKVIGYNSSGMPIILGKVVDADKLPTAIRNTDKEDMGEIRDTRKKPSTRMGYCCDNTRCSNGCNYDDNVYVTMVYFK
jgi:hypothetical protein